MESIGLFWARVKGCHKSLSDMKLGVSFGRGEPAYGAFRGP